MLSGSGPPGSTSASVRPTVSAAGETIDDHGARQRDESAARRPPSTANSQTSRCGVWERSRSGQAGTRRRAPRRPAPERSASTDRCRRTRTSSTPGAGEGDAARRTPGRLRDVVLAVVALVLVAVVAGVVVLVAVEVNAVQHDADARAAGRSAASRARAPRARGASSPSRSRTRRPTTFCARITASVTASTGGVSMTTQSNGPCARFASRWFIRSEASSSDGFGGVRPAVITNRFGSARPLDRVAHARLADEQVRQADAVLQPDRLVQARAGACRRR